MSSEITCEAAEVHLVDFGAYASVSATSTSAPTPEAIRAAAATQGYAAGFAAGMRAASEQSRSQREELHRRLDHSRSQDAELLHAMTQQLSAAAQALADRAAALSQDAEATLLHSSLELAEAILGSELRDGPHAARAALTRALEGWEPQEVRAVRMHPSSAALLPAETTAAAGVRVIPDPGLAPGDAVADLPEGFLDARITHALSRCRAVLAEAAGAS